MKAVFDLYRIDREVWAISDLILAQERNYKLNQLNTRLLICSRII